MSLEVIKGHLYDFPEYYDLVFGSDWEDEIIFLQECFKQLATRSVKRVFEPACGTGRLMYKLAQAGYEVAGNDLNEKAVDFCNRRLEELGFPASAFVGDMADFTVEKKYDAAFNMINSFRHLQTEQEAVNHFKCIAQAVEEGGLFILGLHLNPEDAGDDYEAEEEWSAKEGSLEVRTKLWTMNYDPQSRIEKIGFQYDVFTPEREFRIEDVTIFRCYTHTDMENLIQKSPEWELVDTFDFYYDIEDPIAVDGNTEDVVYVLRRK